MCESCRRTATPRDLQPLRQSSTLLRRPRSWRVLVPRSWAAALYERKSSVINRSGTNPHFFRSLRISFSAACLLGLDQHVDDLALGVDGAPQIDHAAGNLEINLVKMPSRVRLGATPTQICRDHRPEMVHPAPNRFVRDRDSALRQQIFNVAEAQSESKIQPDRLLNDRRREAITVVVDFLHPPGYRATKEIASPEPA